METTRLLYVWIGDYSLVTYFLRFMCVCIGRRTNASHGNGREKDRAGTKRKKHETNKKKNQMGSIWEREREIWRIKKVRENKNIHKFSETMKLQLKKFFCSRHVLHVNGWKTGMNRFVVFDIILRVYLLKNLA